MVDAVGDLLEAGRVKLYCVDSFDEVSWSDRSVPLEERARRHRAYESWVTDRVAAYIGHDSPGAGDAVVTGCSLGAYHALQLALTRADLFPQAICLSGSYDPAPGTPGASAASGRTSPTPPTTCPTWTATTSTGCAAGCTSSSSPARGRGRCTRPGRCRRPGGMGGLLAEQGIPHDLDIWGHDSAHDWPWWQARSPTTCPASVSRPQGEA